VREQRRTEYDEPRVRSAIFARTPEDLGCAGNQPQKGPEGAEPEEREKRGVAKKVLWGGGPATILERHRNGTELFLIPFQKAGKSRKRRDRKRTCKKLKNDGKQVGYRDSKQRRKITERLRSRAGRQRLGGREQIARGRGPVG